MIPPRICKHTLHELLQLYALSQDVWSRCSVHTAGKQHKQTACTLEHAHETEAGWYFETRLPFPLPLSIFS